MTKKTGIAFMLIGAFFVLAAIVLAVSNHIEELDADRSAQEVMDNMMGAISKDAHISALPLPEELETVKIDDHDYIGYISIPSLDLCLPVMAEWSYPNLKISPCHYYGNLKSGMVVAAHNYEYHFGRIKQLKPGDEVYFGDVNGRAYKYETAEVEILKPTAIEEMISDGWDLTLFTCTYGGQSRVTVRCTAIK